MSHPCLLPFKPSLCLLHVCPHFPIIHRYQIPPSNAQWQLFQVLFLTTCPHPFSHHPLSHPCLLPFKPSLCILHACPHFPVIHIGSLPPQTPFQVCRLLGILLPSAQNVPPLTLYRTGAHFLPPLQLTPAPCSLTFLLWACPHFLAICRYLVPPSSSIQWQLFQDHRLLGILLPLAHNVSRPSTAATAHGPALVCH
jgi:hypothetical protein